MEQEKPQSGEGLRGIAGLYTRQEIKKFVSGYLLLLAVVEGLIFFFCWVSYLGDGQTAFPWKAYLIASFLVPVAISFLLGVVAYGFGRYLMPGEEAPADGEVDRPPNRFEEAMLSLRQVPFLVALLLLVLAGGLVYKLDAIVAFVARAGGEAARYLFILVLVVLGVAGVVALVWMILSYRLRCRRLAYLHQFRLEVIERTGMVLLEDETLVDRDGQVVERPGQSEMSASFSRDELTLLPRLPGRSRDGER
ncbi:hypothetical protein EDC39_10363 [Geothermobacter ehrlichii]|uniref:Uncharacterized protein n=1 Tax=Geothermobacter ehrlichii TaxID=213224 RepID=A0A5D3WKN0_9BACT|nr:hypothetical protein [Geothermobacter ehrlichii]TYO99220.1 hypothetical protein EDC39_10363 [Geothermobacter ehrlichii]